MPRELSRALLLECAGMPPLRALSRAKHEGVLHLIPDIAAKAVAALQPVPRQVLVDRLTLLGMSMIRGMTGEERSAWLHETVRLLSDLPQRIVLDAIDECVKEPGRSFAPTVGEIREKAAEPLQRAESEAITLRNLARLIEDGVDIPEWHEPRVPTLPLPDEPKDYCTPEQASEILREFGLRGSAMGDRLTDMMATDEQSRADMIAEGQTPPRQSPDSNPLYV